MSKNDKPNDPALRSAGPTRNELADMRAALVDQLPELAPTWWRRVKAARTAGSVTRLRLLFAEAESRLDHKRRKQGAAVLRILSQLLGLREVVDVIDAAAGTGGNTD